MKTIRLLLYRDITASVLFVAVAFLSLFFFIDLVDQLDSIGRKGRSATSVVITAALELPAHFYDVFPIAVLIGTIYSLARLAQSSEYTILRTGGLGPGRALGLLAVLGVAFAGATFVVGDLVAPASERQSLLMKSRGSDGTSEGKRVEGSGAWLRERRTTPEGERLFSVNVYGASAADTLIGIRVFEFDGDGRLISRLQASEGQVGDQGSWRLSDVETTHWPKTGAADAKVTLVRHKQLDWPSTLSAGVVAAAVLPLASMTTVELWRYSAHLSDQEQSSQEYKIRFWRKALYPLACLVMMALALPFAYMHARSGSVSLKVFGGILLGISFVLLNNLTGFVGVLSGLTPWAVAAAPSLLYLLMSMAAFAWLVRYR